VALARVNLSRAPHCPAAFSLGNEVMETRQDLPFPAPHDVQFYSFLFTLLLPLPDIPPASTLPLAFLHPFFLSACYRPHPGLSRSYYTRRFVDDLRLRQMCPAGSSLPEAPHRPKSSSRARSYVFTRTSKGAAEVIRAESSNEQRVLRISTSYDTCPRKKRSL